MLRSPNSPAPNRFCSPRSIGLDHQVTIRLSSPVAATLAAPTSASLTASHRVRVTLWVQASRWVPFSNSRADQRRAPERADQRRDGDRAAVPISSSSRSNVLMLDAGRSRSCVEAQQAACGLRVDVVEVGEMRPGRPRAATATSASRPTATTPWVRNCRRLSRIIATTPEARRDGRGRHRRRAACRPGRGPPGRPARPSRPGRGSARRCGRAACSAGRCGWPR